MGFPIDGSFSTSDSTSVYNSSKSSEKLAQKTSKAQKRRFLDMSLFNPDFAKILNGQNSGPPQVSIFNAAATHCG